MKPRTGTIAITLVVGIAAFLLTRVIWPDAEGGPQPSSTQLILLIFLGVIDSLLVGLGVAFLIYGLPLVRRFVGAGRLAWLTYLGIAFQLLSWWPHSNLHRVAGDNFNALIAIDYGFHVPLQIGALAMAVFFLAAARGALKARAPQVSAGTAVASPAPA
jgi:hypothetical protein